MRMFKPHKWVQRLSSWLAYGSALLVLFACLCLSGQGMFTILQEANLSLTTPAAGVESSGFTEHLEPDDDLSALMRGGPAAAALSGSKHGVALLAFQSAIYAPQPPPSRDHIISPAR